MSDDHFIFPPGVPEEFKEQLRNQHDRQHMQQEAWEHELARFFDSLSVDQAGTLRNMMRNMAAFPSKGRNAAFFEGVLGGLLHTKFNICLGCEKDHDEVLAEKEAEAVRDGSPSSPSTPEEVPLSDADRKDMMVLYGLDVDPDGSLFCKNCDMRYVSVEDRMLREPGPQGCPGCVHKAKWG